MLWRCPLYDYQVYEQLGNYEQALKDAETAVVMNPDDRGPYHFLADILKKMSTNHQVIKSYDAGIRNEPKSDADYAGRGLNFLRLGEFAVALRDFDKAIELNSRNADVYLYRAIVYGIMKIQQKKEENLRSAARLGVKYAQSTLKSQGLTW